MALGLTGCGLFGPCLEPMPCLSVVDPCSEPNPPPDCFMPCLSPVEPPPDNENAVDRLMDHVQPTVCLSIAPCLEPMPEDWVDCGETPEHPDCPPPAKVKEEVLEKEVLPEDVQKKLSE